MLPTLSFVSLSERVLRGARANAATVLATQFPARASHTCVSPRSPFAIASSANEKPPQTYVSITFYKLWDTIS
jgi:hypothetical protein